MPESRSVFEPSAAPFSGFSPAPLLQGWQHRSVSLWRAQERVMRGMMAAAQIEMRYSQELLQNRLSWLDGKTISAPEAGAQAVQALEATMTLLRDVSDELRSSFTEAVQLLGEAAADAETEAEAALDQGAEKIARGFTKTAETASAAAADATAKLRETSDAVAETVQDVADAAGSSMKRQARRMQP